MIRKILAAMLALMVVDVIAVLWTGGYTLPGVSWRSEHPATSAFFLALMLLGFVLLRNPFVSPADENAYRRAALAVFLACFVVYLSNFRWRGSGDVVAASLQPFELLRHGHLWLNEYYPGFLNNEDISWVYWRNGKVFSMYSSAAGILLLPFYAISAMGSAVVTDALIHQLQKIGASFMIAASATLMFSTFRRHVALKWALVYTAVYAFGASSWSTSSQAIWQHGPSQLFLSLAMYSFFRSEDEPGNSPFTRTQICWLALTGFSLGMASWCRYSNVLIFVIWVLFQAMRKRPFAVGIAGSVLPFCALALDNVLHSGSPFRTGYQPKAIVFNWFSIDGILGLLFSPPRGLLIFSPIILFALAGLWQAIRLRKPGPWGFLAVSFAATVVFYGSYGMWSGGYCFGPRYFADITPLWCLWLIPLTPMISSSVRWARLFALALGLSIATHAAGAFFTWRWEKLYGLSDWSWGRNPWGFLACQILTPGAPSRADGIAALTILMALLLAAWRWGALLASPAKAQIGNMAKESGENPAARL
jgi:hypothetical protein